MPVQKSSGALDTEGGVSCRAEQTDGATLEERPEYVEWERTLLSVEIMRAAA